MAIDGNATLPTSTLVRSFAAWYKAVRSSTRSSGRTSFSRSRDGSPAETCRYSRGAAATVYDGVVLGHDQRRRRVFLEQPVMGVERREALEGTRIEAAGAWIASAGASAVPGRRGG